MKKKLIAVCFMLLIIGLVSCQSEPVKDQADHSEKIVVMVQNDTLFINKNKIASPWKLEIIQKFFGKHDNVFNLANNIYTYDKKGIYFYEPLDPKNEVSEINLLYGKGNYKFSPKGIFTGDCSINGLKISDKTTADNIQKLELLWINSNINQTRNE